MKTQLFGQRLAKAKTKIPKLITGSLQGESTGEQSFPLAKDL